jgi:hypothetical protein
MIRFVPTCLLLAGCSGNESAEENLRPAAVEAVVAPELLQQTWQVRMADRTVRAPYEQHPGWAKLFVRDLEGASGSFTAEPRNPEGLLRAHTELAALYRQGARLAAEATLQVYEVDRQETDPAQTTELVRVAKALLDPDHGRDALEALYGDAKGAWRQASYDPTTRRFRGPAGEWLPAQLPERSPGAKAVDVIDPAVLLAVAADHEEAAKATASDPRIVDQWLAPWHLPFEPETAADELPIPDALLFGAFATHPADVAFFAEACGGAAKDAWTRAPNSPLARVIAGAIEDADEPHLSVQRLLERADAFSREIQAAMARSANGEEGFHRTFSEFGRLGALRAGVCIAEALGQPDDAGLLRVDVNDLAEGPSRDPIFTLSLAAWDAAHQNAVRSLDLVHSLTNDFPQLQMARVPLDAMSVRLSRNSAPTAPVH